MFRPLYPPATDYQVGIGFEFEGTPEQVTTR